MRRCNARRVGKALLFVPKGHQTSSSRGAYSAIDHGAASSPTFFSAGRADARPAPDRPRFRHEISLHSAEQGTFVP
jgi:hypothetical protein